MTSIKLAIGLEEWYDYIDKDNILRLLSKKDKSEYLCQVLDSIIEWGLYTDQKVYPVLELLNNKSPELHSSGVNDTFYFLFKSIQKEILLYSPFEYSALLDFDLVNNLVIVNIKEEFEYAV